jgi:hypothetical protein
VEGKNLLATYRYGEGSYERLPSLRSVFASYGLEHSSYYGVCAD